MKNYSSTPKLAMKSNDPESETNDLVAKMHQGQTNILVAVRCRPLTKREKEQNDTKSVHILDTKLLIMLDPYASPNKRTKEKRYAFDFVFSASISQKEIFDKTTIMLLDGVLNGFNATVFAYGPTGAGKTYTMLGEGENMGLMLMSFLEIFNKINTLSKERKYSVRVSYLEIYNEVVRDLLNPSNLFLDIREDPQRGVVVSDLSELEAKGPEEVIDCLRLGNKRRTCEPTEANLTSSRSHAVLQIVVEYKDKASGTEAEIYTGKLSLIDLAGSERAANTKNRGIRLIEGANINRSLLALGNCINALFESNNKGVKLFVPYRDSKLTRLLKDSLGGKCRTVMIACISPFYGYYEDTHNTLEYANRAKNIKTKVERNVVNVDYHVSKYKERIDELREEIKLLRKELNGSSKPDLPPIDDNKNYFLKELEDHFLQETRVKGIFYTLIDQIDDINEQLLIQENELNNIRFKSSERSPLIQSYEDKVELLKRKLLVKEENFRDQENEINILEHKRKGFDIKWIDLPQQSLSSLQLALQRNKIKLMEFEKEKQKIHNEKQLKYKNLYISFLRDQLKDKLEFLEKQEVPTPTKSERKEKLYTKQINGGRSKPFSYRLQGEVFLKKGIYSESVLPTISPKNNILSHAKSRDSKIPKFNSKHYDDSSSTSSATEKSAKKAKIQERGNSKLPRRRNFGPIGSNSENESAKFDSLKISDKFKKSPYALWKNGSKGKKPRN